MMGGFALLWILILAAIAFGVYSLVKKTGGAGFASFGSPTDSAEEILRKRYARGEIDREEYEDRLREIQR